MLIQGYTIDTSNILMLPYINRDNLRSLKDKLSKVTLSDTNSVSIPHLRLMLSNRDTANKITNVLNEIFDKSASSEIIKTVNDLPMLNIKTTITNSNNNEKLSYTLKENFYNLDIKSDCQCIFELNIYRQGCSKMNVYSKKFNKQKEEFWFLIFVEENEMTFRKFSFSRNFKKIVIPVKIPKRRGKSFLQTYFFYWLLTVIYRVDTF